MIVGSGGGAEDLSRERHYRTSVRSRHPSRVDQEKEGCLSQNGQTEVMASHGDVYAPSGQGVLNISEDGVSLL